MQYALLYNKKDSKYHIYKSTIKDINIEKLEYISYKNEQIYLHTNCFGKNFIKGKPIYIDIKINKYPLCNEDIKMNDLDRLEKQKLTFMSEKYNLNIYNPNQYYYLINKVIDINGKEYPSIYAERKIIMIFLALFENDICSKCFLEFINELKDK